MIIVVSVLKIYNYTVCSIDELCVAVYKTINKISLPQYLTVFMGSFRKLANKQCSTVSREQLFNTCCKLIFFFYQKELVWIFFHMV